MTILTKDHYAKKEVGPACLRLIYTVAPETENFLRKVLKENPFPEAKGHACFTLARYRKRLAGTARALKANPALKASYKRFYGEDFFNQITSAPPKEMDKEVEKLLLRVTTEFKEIKTGYGRTLGKMAAGDLFEIRNLGIGKVAPDIEGEDVEGVKFKLSDYRGKVVVIDFWGDW